MALQFSEIQKKICDFLQVFIMLPWFLTSRKLVVMKLLERIAMTFQLRSLIFLCYGLGDGKCESIPQMGFTYSYDYYVVCHRKFILYSLTMKSDSSFYKGPIYFYTPQLDHLQWLLMELQFGFVSGLKRSFVNRSNLWDKAMCTRYFDIENRIKNKSETQTPYRERR